MKLSKWEGGILLLAALVLAFTAGWSLGFGGRGEPVRVSTQRELTQAGRSSLSTPAAQEPKDKETPGKVNINTAGGELLETLPGIGAKKAADIIAEREENGPYRFPEDIIRVKGIGEESLAKILDYITTEDEP